MKSLLGIIITSLWANVSVAMPERLPPLPRRERPVLKAELRFVEDGDTEGYPQVVSLIMNKKVARNRVSSFTLVEETDIVCVTTPCPTRDVSKFIVNSSQILKNGGSTLYEAIEVLNIEPGLIGPMARRLTLIDHTTNGLGEFDPSWVMTIQRYGTEATYEGNPEPLCTIQ